MSPTKRAVAIAIRMRVLLVRCFVVETGEVLCSSAWTCSVLPRSVLYSGRPFITQVHTREGWGESAPAYGVWTTCLGSLSVALGGTMCGTLRNLSQSHQKKRIQRARRARRDSPSGRRLRPKQALELSLRCHLQISRCMQRSRSRQTSLPGKGSGN
jgi:hypothetical protein